RRRSILPAPSAPTGCSAASHHTSDDLPAKSCRLLAFVNGGGWVGHFLVVSLTKVEGADAACARLSLLGDRDAALKKLRRGEQVAAILPPGEPPHRGERASVQPARLSASEPLKRVKVLTAREASVTSIGDERKPAVAQFNPASLL